MQKCEGCTHFCVLRTCVVSRPTRLSWFMIILFLWCCSVWFCLIFSFPCPLVSFKCLLSVLPSSNLPPCMLVSPCLSVLFPPCFLLCAFPSLSYLSSSLSSPAPHPLISVSMYLSLCSPFTLSQFVVCDSFWCTLSLLLCLLLCSPWLVGFGFLISYFVFLYLNFV